MFLEASEWQIGRKDASDLALGNFCLHKIFMNLMKISVTKFILLSYFST